MENFLLLSLCLLKRSSKNKFAETVISHLILLLFLDNNKIRDPEQNKEMKFNGLFFWLGLIKI